MTDPYAILGVSRTASADEIRRAYRTLAKALHPDARPGDKASEERFKQVGQAFKLLSDADKRAKFDRGEIDGEGNERAAFHFRSRPGGSAGQRGPTGRFEDISDLFSDLFSENQARAGRRGPGAGAGAGAGGFASGFGGDAGRRGPGADLKAGVTVTFEEAMRGAKRRVGLSAARAVEVSIPAGVETGTVLRLRGQGEPSLTGGPPGDALVEVRVAPHAFFRREGDDVWVDLPITPREAAFGAVVRAPTVDGPVEVRVPEGANSLHKLRLRGKGAPKAEGGRGDQIIQLVIDLPTNDPALDSFLETSKGLISIRLK